MRLCSKVDDILLTQRPLLSLWRYRKLQAILDAAQSVAESDKSLFPTTAEEFVELVLLLHQQRFHLAVPEIAGRFRSVGEDIEFGGTSDNKLQGSPAEVIVPHLKSVFQTSVLSDSSPNDKASTAKRCADFLERFFRVHPFVDGNGRVGRQLARLLCESGKLYTFKAFATDAKSRRTYVTALEYAHRHRPGSEHPRYVTKPAGHLVFLSSWLERHLILMPTSLSEADPPNWLDSGRG